MIQNKSVPAAACSNSELSEKLKTFLFNLPNTLICVIGMDGYFNYLNPAWTQILGYAIDELLYKPAIDFIHQEDQEEYIRNINNLEADQNTANFENRYFHKDGSYRTISWTASPDHKEQLLYCVGRDITKRKQITDRLREGEQKFKALFNHTLEFISILSPDGIVVEVNQTALNYSRLKESDVLGQLFWETPWWAHSPDQQNWLRKSIKKAASGKVIYGEVHHLTSDGDLHYIDFSIKPIRDDQGNIIYLVPEGRDITERRKVESALQESEEKFRHIVESSPMGMHMYTLQPDGKLIFSGANPAADTILGVDNSQFIGKTIEEAFPPLQGTEVPVRYRAAALKGASWKTEQISYVDDKITGAFEVHAFQTSPNKMTAIFLDITDRKRFEAALLQSQIFNETLINTSPDIIFIYDLVEKKNIYSNPGIMNVLGYSIDEIRMMGDNILSDLMYPDDFQNYLKNTIPRYGSAGDGELIEHEYRMKHKDGDWRWLLSKESIFLRMDDGAPKQIFGITSDITDRKKSADQIQKDLKEKEILLKEIHHRVKNNMNVITSLLSLQSQKITNKEDALAAFEKSRNRIFSMALVHEQLYKSDDLSQIDMKSYIESLTGKLRQFTASDINIEFKLHVDKVFLDVNLAVPCGLILNELVTNAYKHAFNERKKGEIVISFQHINDKSYELKVMDDGVGLPKHIDIHTTNTLGLHLLSLLSRQLDGTLKVTRVRGTTFTIQFKK